MSRFEWTQEADSLLRQHHAQGHNYPATAADIGCTIPEVSRRMKFHGLIPNHKPPAAANQAVRENIAAAREEMAASALADCINLRQRMWDQYSVVVNGPEGPAVEVLDLPDAKAINDFANAISKLETVSANLDRMGAARSADIAGAALTRLQEQLEREHANDDD